MDFQSFEFADKAFLVDGQGAPVRGDTVLMASGQTSSITPTYRHPPGTVLTKKTGDGKFYLSTDTTNADAPAAASVTALITNPGSGGWDGTLNLKGHWGSLAVTLSSDDTDNAVRDAINAAFAALDPENGPAVATVSGSRVVITNRDTGKGTYLHAVHATVSAMFGASGADDRGTDPVVLVTSDFVDLQNLNGTAVDREVPTIKKGRFRLTELSGYTAEALAVLERGGSEIL